MNPVLFMSRPARAAAACALLLATACESERVARVEATETEFGETNVTADAVLRDASRRLTNEDEFTFEVVRLLDAALLDGRRTPEVSDVVVSIDRPDKLYAATRTASSMRHFYFDGRRVAIFDETKQLYSLVDMPGTIDEMIVKLDEEYGFGPPLAEIISNDLYQNVQAQVRAKTLVGDTTVGGVACNRVAFKGELADGARTDGEVWISSETRLPCGIREFFRDLGGSPQASVNFTMWDMGAELEDDAFTFNPPPGSRQIRMVPLEAAN